MNLLTEVPVTFGRRKVEGGSRKKIRRLLSDFGVGTVVVEHRDRLGGMNTELVEAALSAAGRRLVILDEDEVDDDLVRDMVDVRTSFCAWLYGCRSARRRAEKALRFAAHDMGPMALMPSRKYGFVSRKRICHPGLASSSR